MWGGWYKHPSIMSLLGEALSLYQDEANHATQKVSELAVILDQDASYGLSDEYYMQMNYHQFIELGFVGAPYDIYHINDVEKIKDSYKALLYLTPSKGSFKGNILLSKRERIEKKSKFMAQELAEFLRQENVHVYSEGNIVYANARFVCLTATKKGKVNLMMPNECKLKSFTVGAIYEGKAFLFEMECNQTLLLEIIE